MGKIQLKFSSNSAQIQLKFSSNSAQIQLKFSSNSVSFRSLLHLHQPSGRYKVATKLRYHIATWAGFTSNTVGGIRANFDEKSTITGPTHCSHVGPTFATACRKGHQPVFFHIKHRSKWLGFAHTCTPPPTEGAMSDRSSCPYLTNTTGILR
jgi:hypothetical protein